MVLIFVVALSAGLSAQPYTFEHVAAGLKHPDPATRIRAIQILKDADYLEAASPIADLLGDPDDRVQLAALDAERTLFSTAATGKRERIGLVIERRSRIDTDSAEAQLALRPRTVPAVVLAGLAVALRDDNLRIRQEAVTATALIAPYPCRLPSVASATDRCSHLGNALIDNVNSRDADLRRSAMRTLGLLGYQNAAKALADQLSYYQTGPDAQAAMEGLAGISDPTSVSIFRPYLTSGNADARRLAVEGLARAGDNDELAELQQLGQTEQSNGVLLAIHYAIIKLGAAGATPAPLIAALGSTAQRPFAIAYLLDLAPSIVPELSAELADANPEIRTLAADLVGFSRASAAIPALQSAAKDANPATAAAARRAIERIEQSAAPFPNR